MKVGLTAVLLLLLVLGLALQALSMPKLHVSELARYDRMAERLGEYRRLWKRASSPRGVYRFAVSVGCFCSEAGDYVLTIKHGHVARVERVGMSTEVDSEWVESLSVENVFRIIARAIRNRADALEVSYDREYGYPLRLRIDYDKHMFDEELELDMQLISAVPSSSSGTEQEAT